MATLSTARVLTGWKEIAVYLGRGVRTVQRYEQTLDMPVRRMSGCVIAFPDELDGWFKASSEAKASSFELYTVRESNVLEMYRRAMKNLYQNVNLLLERIAGLEEILQTRQRTQAKYLKALAGSLMKDIEMLEISATKQFEISMSRPDGNEAAQKWSDAIALQRKQPKPSGFTV